MPKTTTIANTPVGPLAVVQDGAAVVALNWASPKAAATPVTSVAKPVVQALTDYFAGRQASFADLNLTPAGTPFQQKVWQALRQIPVGQVKTYGEIAQQLNTSPRAVGLACGANPIPVLIPCHRVVGQTGALTGYSGAGGVATKAKLLNHERKRLNHD